MKEIWSEDAGEILSEIRLNCEEQVAMTLLGSTVSPTFVTLRSVVKDADREILEFEKPEELELDGELFVFYLRNDQQLMRGFKLEVLRQTNRFFRAAIPVSIFKVQRRKFPRVYTAEGSTLTFAPKDSRRIIHAQIIDVSLEGAKIFGNLVGLKQGTALSPITLTLSFDDRRSNDVVVNVSEAVVVREIRVKEKVELSFHFQNKDADDLLQKYIDLRILEQEVYG